MIVATARQAAELLAPCFTEEKESVAVLHLDVQDGVLGDQLWHERPGYRAPGPAAA